MPSEAAKKRQAKKKAQNQARGKARDIKNTDTAVDSSDETKLIGKPKNGVHEIENDGKT